MVTLTQTVPRKGSTDEKRGGGGHAQRRYFFSRRTPFVNAFVVRSRHSSHLLTLYRGSGTVFRALLVFGNRLSMHSSRELGQNHGRYAPPCRSVTSTSLLASLLASSCLIVPCNETNVPFSVFQCARWRYITFRCVTGVMLQNFFSGVGNRPKLPIPQSTVHTVTFDDNSRPRMGQQPACRRVVRR